MVAIITLVRDVLEPKNGIPIDFGSLDPRKAYLLRFEREGEAPVVVNVKGTNISDILKREQARGGNPRFYVEEIVN
jgi:hypothetical protein